MFSKRISMNVISYYSIIVMLPNNWEQQKQMFFSSRPDGIDYKVYNFKINMANAAYSVSM